MPSVVEPTWPTAASPSSVWTAARVVARGQRGHTRAIRPGSDQDASEPGTYHSNAPSLQTGPSRAARPYGRDAVAFGRRAP